MAVEKNLKRKRSSGLFKTKMYQIFDMKNLISKKRVLRLFENQTGAKFSGPKSSFPIKDL